MGLEDDFRKKMQQEVVKQMKAVSKKIEQLRCPIHHAAPKISDFNNTTGNFNTVCCCDKLSQMVKAYKV
jgi:hypothetical protein